MAGNPAPWRRYGLIRERAQEAARTIIGPEEDPFRLALLDRETHDRLEEEATALSLMGGRRVVRVRDAADSQLKAVEHILGQTTDTLVILEAPGLSSRSKLRALLERRPDCASIGCYPEEGRTLESSITKMLATHRIRIDNDALHWLINCLSADRSATRGEVEKLALYAGDGGTLSLEDVRTCIGDAGSVSLEDAAFAATQGNRAEADLALERALAEGISPLPLFAHSWRICTAYAGCGRPWRQAKAARMHSRPCAPPFFLNAQPDLAGPSNSGHFQP